MLPKRPKAALAFTALALLTLSACGGGENTAGPTSQSASASGTVSASASSSATAASLEASPSESIAYSGGSKAPTGEYRPADEHGPAQNVPKPKVPEGMNVETLEGLEKFIAYWNDMRNYAYQTGDVIKVRSLVNKSFQQEQDFYNAVENLYDSGGWVVGGKSTVHYSKDRIISLGNGLYSIASNIETEDSVIVHQGEATYNDNSNSVYDGVDLRVEYTSVGWKVVSAKVVSGE